MIIFPAIDLKGGQVVRLAEGDMDRATVYGDNPAAQAQIFADQAASTCMWWILTVPSRAARKTGMRSRVSSRPSPAMCSLAAASARVKR
jgi:phosphoribosylformimino-5-aminoimidazole carboxamide ribonucleotide (ProFAR) isomerase